MSSQAQLQANALGNIKEIKSIIKVFNEDLIERSKSDETIEALLKARSDFIDNLLTNCWCDLLALSLIHI